MTPPYWGFVRNVRSSQELRDVNIPGRPVNDRLRVDTRKWMAARLAPKKYGDRVSHDVQGNTTLNLQPAVRIKVESSAAPEAGSGVLLDGDGDIVRGSGGRR